jgi:hypothetical protein
MYNNSASSKTFTDASFFVSAFILASQKKSISFKIANSLVSVFSVVVYFSIETFHETIMYKFSFKSHSLKTSSHASNFFCLKNQDVL